MIYAWLCWPSIGFNVFICFPSRTVLQIESWVLAKLNVQAWTEVSPTAMAALSSPGYSRDFMESKRLNWRNMAKAFHYCLELQKFQWSDDEKERLMQAWVEGALDMSIKNMEHLPGQWPMVKKLMRERCGAHIRKKQPESLKVRLWWGYVRQCRV